MVRETCSCGGKCNGNSERYKRLYKRCTSHYGFTECSKCGRIFDNDMNMEVSEEWLEDLTALSRKNRNSKIDKTTRTCKIERWGTSYSRYGESYCGECGTYFKGDRSMRLKIFDDFKPNITLCKKCFEKLRRKFIE